MFHLYKNLITSLLLLMVSRGLTAQISITGQTNCVLPGSEYLYTISGSWQSSDIPQMQWCAFTAIVGGSETCKTGVIQIKVVIPSGFTSGNISVSCPSGSANITVSKNAGTLQDGGMISPSTISVFTGATPQTIGAGYPTGGSCDINNYVYQWETAAAVGGPFTAVSGANTQFYEPPVSTVEKTVYYRRKTTYSGASVYTQTGSVVYTHEPVTGGTINTASIQVEYGGKPELTQSPARGWACEQSGIVYTWQRSTAGAGGPWTDIGTGAAYPTGVVTVTTLPVTIRRKAVCGTTTAYTNNITFSVMPLTGGIIYTEDTVAIIGRKLNITSDRASGGNCYPQDYLYEWQQSVSGGAWTAIGSGVEFPATAPAVTADVKIRRKVTCGGQVVYSNELLFKAFTEAYLADNRTYVIKNESWKPGVTTPAALDALTVGDRQRTTIYYDGLGRPVQEVSQQAGGAGKDMVQQKYYDEYGRETIQYLPYSYTAASTGSFASNGKYKLFAEEERQQFYNTQYPGEPAYGATEFEMSPLNKSIKTMQPGASWVGAGRGITNKYPMNTANDQVRIWNITPGAMNLPVSPRAYPAGTLFKIVTTNEQGQQVVVYKNNAGLLLLKKVQLAATAQLSTHHDGWLCTYYVYDDLGNLRVVIPPLAVEKIKTGWALTTAIADELCFQYQYDSRQRKIIEKTPGSGAMQMVYDNRDRLVFKQDAEQAIKTPVHEWEVTFYDNQNRPVVLALYPSNQTRDQLQTTMNSVSGTTTTLNYTMPGTADLAVPERVAGITLYEATNSIIFTDGFDSENGAAFEAKINPALQGTTEVSVATNILPGITGYEPIKYFYYDDYTFPGAKPYNTTEIAKLPLSEYPNGVSVKRNIYPRGALTATKVKILGTSQWLASTIHYNDIGKPAQTLADNITSGEDITSLLYDFRGMELSTYVHHRNPNATALGDTRLLSTITYDANGRLSTVKKRLNDNVALERKLAQYVYDELGRVKTKQLGFTTSTTSLETLVYSYNIRGWLQAVNKAFVNTPSSTSNWFGMELGYDNGFAVNQYNGNISGTKWKSQGDGVARKYDFTYDNADRILGADFNQNPGNGTWSKTGADFSVSNLGYDANGNILSMQQKGLKAGGSAVIDNLQYGYYPNSNRLRLVRDDANDPNSSLGDFKETAANHTSNLSNPTTDFDYTFDANASLITDKNKSISQISYNHLRLPSLISITGKGDTRFLYDADGNKVRKIVTDNTLIPSKTTITDYAGAFVYQDNSFQLLGFDEGRVRAVFKTGVSPEYKFDYFIKDHLSNVRVVLTEQSETMVYAASMETAAAAKENALFSNIDNTRNAKPVGYPTDQTTKQNEFVARLNARDGGKKIGPSLVLKVMAGDTIQIGAKAFYKSQEPRKDNQPAPVNDMLASLIQAFSSGTSGDNSHASITAQPGSPFGNNFTSSDYQRLQQKDPDQQMPDKPKAYLNFVLFDEQFKLVEDNSGVKQVQGEPDQLQTLAKDKMVMQKGGFLYVYTSNESPQDVFFDNVIVTQSTGPLLEETHYYPFGLTMAGISTKAAGVPENRMLFNSKELQHNEFSDGAGIEWYDYGARMYDQQIGRFHRLDRFADLALDFTPYHYANNNPILYLDINGDSVVPSRMINWPNFDTKTNTIGLNTVSVKPNKEDNSSYPWLATTTTALGTASFLMHNNYGWYSYRMYKFYSPNFHGNRYTGGRVKSAKLASTRLTHIGYALGLWNAYNINTQYLEGEINEGQMAAEQGSNAISTLGGILGVGWGVGWEIGRAISENTWYRESVRPLIQDALGIKRDESSLGAESYKTENK